MLDKLIEFAKQKNASDIHISVNTEIRLRINGSLFIMETKPRFEDVNQIINKLLNEPQLHQLEKYRDLDISYENTICRNRINIYYQASFPAIAIRLIPSIIPTIESLRLPNITNKFATFNNGLVLITGPTGSGKTATLAAIINQINRTRSAHIISLENPIEYLHTNNKSLINQREVFSDVNDFQTGLRSALRQDPDVIVLGEMRDFETISTALTASETGHLVLSTLHTPDSTQTIDRIIDTFPGYQQSQVRNQLASCLRGVISQQLVTSTKNILVPACEILLSTPAIKNLIRSNHTHTINNTLSTTRSSGMQSMDLALAELVNNKMVFYEQALSKAHNIDLFKSYINKGVQSCQ